MAAEHPQANTSKRIASVQEEDDDKSTVGSQGSHVAALRASKRYRPTQPNQTPEDSPAAGSVRYLSTWQPAPIQPITKQRLEEQLLQQFLQRSSFIEPLMQQPIQQGQAAQPPANIINTLTTKYTQEGQAQEQNQQMAQPNAGVASGASISEPNIGGRLTHAPTPVQQPYLPPLQGGDAAATTDDKNFDLQTFRLFLELTNLAKTASSEADRAKTAAEIATAKALELRRHAEQLNDAANEILASLLQADPTAYTANIQPPPSRGQSR